MSRAADCAGHALGIQHDRVAVVMWWLVDARYFGGEECFEVLREGAEATARLVEARDVSRLKQDFDLCGAGIENDKDLWVFQTNVMGNFQVGRSVGACR